MNVDVSNHLIEFTFDFQGYYCDDKDTFLPIESEHLIDATVLYSSFQTKVASVWHQMNTTMFVFPDYREIYLDTEDEISISFPLVDRLDCSNIYLFKLKLADHVVKHIHKHTTNKLDSRENYHRMFKAPRKSSTRRFQWILSSLKVSNGDELSVHKYLGSYFRDYILKLSELTRQIRNLPVVTQNLTFDVTVYPDHFDSPVHVPGKCVIRHFQEFFFWWWLDEHYTISDLSCYSPENSEVHHDNQAVVHDGFISPFQDDYFPNEDESIKVHVDFHFDASTINKLKSNMKNTRKSRKIEKVTVNGVSFLTLMDASNYIDVIVARAVKASGRRGYSLQTLSNLKYTTMPCEEVVP